MLRGNERQDPTLDNDSHFMEDDWEAYRPHVFAMAGVNIASSVAGIIGNCIVLAIMIKNKEHFQGINLFIAALALADLTVCIVVQPVFIALLFERLPESAVLQVFENYVFGITIQTSLNLLLTIAIFRINEIARPFFYRSFATKMRILVVVAFVCAISVAQGVLFNRSPIKHAEPFFQYATIIAFLITYAIIYRIAWKHRNVIAIQERSLAFNHNIRCAHFRKSTVTAAIISGVFVVCFFPFSVVNLIDEIEDGEMVLSKWAITIVCCNSSMNAYIYTLRSRNFKNAVAKTLRSLNCFTNG